MADDEELDLSRLQPREGQLKRIKPGRKPKLHPAAKLVRQSYEEDRTLAVDVPAREARKMVSNLRQYAMKEGLGVTAQIQRITTNEAGEVVDIQVIPFDRANELLTDPEEILTVAFQGREKTRGE